MRVFDRSVPSGVLRPSGSTTLTALAAGFRGAGMVVGEISTTLLTAFSASFRGAQRVMREIAATFMAALASRRRGELAIPRKTALFTGNALPAFASDFPLFRRIHGREATI